MKAIVPFSWSNSLSSMMEMNARIHKSQMASAKIAWCSVSYFVVQFAA